MNDENRYLHPAAGTEPHTDSRGGWRSEFTTRRVLGILAVLIALALVAWFLTPKGAKAPGGRFAGQGPMPVVGAAASTGPMPITVIGLGAVTPLATVTVQSQISGQIMQISFKEGQNVKKGDPLILIDPRPYDVALEQAQGSLERDKALLDNARIDLNRYQTLWSQDSIAEQQLATQKALVVQDEGNVKADQAAIDSAKLNLVYCHISSPIAGRVGLQQVNVGNYVTPNEPNGLAVITQLQPITVVFTMAEDGIPQLMQQLHAGKTLTATAYDRTNTHQLGTGTLQSVDSQIDPTTGTIKLKAVFPNADLNLFPQQFVNIVLLLDTLQNATLVPQAAIQRGAPGTYVYVVDTADQTVSVRTVTLGPGDANNITITQGLKPGETVVIDGADKLKDGAKVSLRTARPTSGGTPAQHPHGQGQGKGQNGHHRQQQSGGQSGGG
jgi:membrane fusion protein, multidrug efflux system